MLTRALLIDDDPEERQQLKRLLAAFPDLRVVGEAESLKEGKALARRAKYDLAFVDIRLGVHSGFELAPVLRRGTRVIFVSGHDADALRAFELNASDYLVKPVTRARLLEALGRVRKGAARRDGLRSDDTINLSSGKRARYAGIGELTLIEAQQNYSQVHLFNGERVLVRRSIKSWEDLMPLTHFVRVHRQALVNLRYVVRCEGNAKDGGWVHVVGGAAAIRVGRRGWAELHERLGKRFWNA